LENKIGRLTTQENKEKLLNEKLWTQLNKNGYVRNKGIEGGKAKKKKKMIKKEEGKELVWYNQYRSTHEKDQSNIEKGKTQHL
jgi:hypothetical protein